MKENYHPPYRPPYGPLVPTCKSFGINRTRSYEYAKSGLIETFRMGSKQYVTLASLESLPQRMAELASEAA